jgi:Icc-related predicted phosphoesterase
MKILIISDRVEPELDKALKPERFSDVELILSCGDLPPEYLASLRSRLNVPLYYVLGNHDLRYNSTPPLGCANLDGRFIRHNGLGIIGFSGSRWYNGNPNQYTESQMRRKIRKHWLTLWWRGVDIVIAHAPPRGIHDREDLCHRGFNSFIPLIRRHTPRYFIHGHIHMNFNHPRERMTVFETTRVINAFGHYLLETDEDV